jgi:hypothetical protein
VRHALFSAPENQRCHVYHPIPHSTYARSCQDVISKLRYLFYSSDARKTHSHLLPLKVQSIWELHFAYYFLKDFQYVLGCAEILPPVEVCVFLVRYSFPCALHTTACFLLRFFEYYFPLCFAICRSYFLKVSVDSFFSLFSPDRPRRS